MDTQWGHISQLVWLWVLVAPAAAYMLWRRWRDRALRAFAQPALLGKITQGVDPRRERRRLLLLLSACCLIVLGLAQPRWGFRWEEVHQRGIDIMVCLDISKSMLAQDVKPSRLERSKREIHDLVSVLQGDRIGIVAFSGTSFVQCPLTTEYSYALEVLDSLEPDVLPIGGTDIGGAIEKALDSFDPKLDKSRIIILITDGEDHEHLAVQSARTAAEREVKIYTIGIGDPVGAPVPTPEGFLEYKGEKVVSKMDEELLRQVAQITGAAYVRAAGGQANLDDLYVQEINKLAKQEYSARTVKKYTEQFQVPLLFAFILLGIDMLLNRW